MGITLDGGYIKLKSNGIRGTKLFTPKPGENTVVEL